MKFFRSFNYLFIQTGRNRGEIGHSHRAVANATNTVFISMQPTRYQVKNVDPAL
jgi:hypothetical protein